MHYLSLGLVSIIIIIILQRTVPVLCTATKSACYSIISTLTRKVSFDSPWAQGVSGDHSYLLGQCFVVKVQSDEDILWEVPVEFHHDRLLSLWGEEKVNRQQLQAGIRVSSSIHAAWLIMVLPLSQYLYTHTCAFDLPVQQCNY